MSANLPIPAEFAEIAAICTASEGVIGNRSALTVNARDLHAGLQSKRDFSSWIKTRITKYGFQEGVDYQILLTKSGEQTGSGGHNAKEYDVTLDMAKELSMVENNDQGRLARRYFIWREQQALVGSEHLTAQQTGGIVKAGLGKLKRELLSELKPIETQLAELSSRMDQAMSSYDPSATFTTDYLPALEVLKDHHVLPKGRRALSANCSRMLKRYLIATDRGWMVRISRETGRFIFHVDGIRDWLKVEGAAVIKDHKDAVMGQHQLALKDSLVRRAKKATQPPFAAAPAKTA